MVHVDVAEELYGSFDPGFGDDRQTPLNPMRLITEPSQLGQACPLRRARITCPMSSFQKSIFAVLAFLPLPVTR